MFRFTAIALISVFLLSLSLPKGNAQAPAISTTWSIANGAESPPIYLEGSGFDPESDKFDFTVDMGTTGLEYDSVAFVDVSHVRFNFHGTAQAGTITIQANTSAFTPISSQASNVIEIVVPVPFIPQSITFTVPTTIKVKDKDLPPNATSTSGLPVVLTSNTPSACTIDFLKIHAVAAGICSITATVNGNSIYSDAPPITRSLIVLSNTSAEPSKPVISVPKETNLASVSYDPSHETRDVFVALIESANQTHEAHTLVELELDPGTTNKPAVFFISSFSSDEETKAGYFVARIKAVDIDGKAIASLKKVTEIEIPAGAIDAIPSWSFDGLIWHKLKQVNSEVLPTDLHAGYFIKSDGRIAFLTDYLMLFGYRKDQSILSIPAAQRSISEGAQIQITTKGGSGDGAVTFASRTEDICSISATGLVSGIKAGACSVYARKAATGVYANTLSSDALVTIKPKSVVVNLPNNDHLYSDLCHELSYSISKSSSQVAVNLCLDDAGQTGALEVGTKSQSGKWSYVVAKRELLDGNGQATFSFPSVLKKGQIIRVKVNGKIRIAATIGAS